MKISNSHVFTIFILSLFTRSLLQLRVNYRQLHTGDHMTSHDCHMTNLSQRDPDLLNHARDIVNSSTIFSQYPESSSVDAVVRELTHLITANTILIRV